MTAVSGLLALFSVLVFCGFLSRKLELNAALLPLPVMGGIVLWLLLWGMIGQLWLGGLLVYLLAAAALGWLIYKKQLAEAVNCLKTPGTVFFAGAGLFFLVLFAATQPMFILWDEFTFWGTACKLTKLQNVLHPAAEGLLLARAYNPALPLTAYFFQFFGTGFSEWSVYAALDTLFAATLSAMTAPLCSKRWSGAAILLAGGFLLPFFFTAPAIGGISNVYVSAMGDLFLGAVFGGSLCVYLNGKDRPAGLAAAGMSLVYLTLIKDMGLAYALIAAGTMALDWLFAAGRPTLKRLGKTVGLGLALAVPVPVLFLGWSRYVAALTGVDKTSVGNQEASISPVQMLTAGVQQLFGIGEPDEKFQTIKANMLASPITVPVCLLGGGLLALAAIFAVMGVSALGLPKGEKHGPVLISAVLLAGLGVFLLFHLFLYAYNFQEIEALVLKDYIRYIGPYYLGFMLLAMGFLAKAAAAERPFWLTRLSVLGLTAILAFFVGWRGTPAAGFLDYPKGMYEERTDIARRMEPINEILKPADKVLLIKQGDQGGGWNYYGYAMNATLSGGFRGHGYGGPEDESWPTTHMNFISPEEGAPGMPEVYPYQVVCDAEDLRCFLNDVRYEYILVDTPDGYITELAEAFGLEGLPDHRTDRDYLIRVHYEGEKITWELVSGGDAL